MENLIKEQIINNNKILNKLKQYTKQLELILQTSNIEKYNKIEKQIDITEQNIKTLSKLKYSIKEKNQIDEIFKIYNTVINSNNLIDETYKVISFNVTEEKTEASHTYIIETMDMYTTIDSEYDKYMKKRIINTKTIIEEMTKIALNILKKSDTFKITPKLQEYYKLYKNNVIDLYVFILQSFMDYLFSEKKMKEINFIVNVLEDDKTRVFLEDNTFTMKSSKEKTAEKVIESGIIFEALLQTFDMVPSPSFTLSQIVDIILDSSSNNKVTKDNIHTILKKTTIIINKSINNPKEFNIWQLLSNKIYDFEPIPQKLNNGVDQHTIKRYNTIEEKESNKINSQNKIQINKMDNSDTFYLLETVDNNKTYKILTPWTNIYDSFSTKSTKIKYAIPWKYFKKLYRQSPSKRILGYNDTLESKIMTHYNPIDKDKFLENAIYKIGHKSSQESKIEVKDLILSIKKELYKISKEKIKDIDTFINMIYSDELTNILYQVTIEMLSQIIKYNLKEIIPSYLSEFSRIQVLLNKKLFDIYTNEYKKKITQLSKNKQLTKHQLQIIYEEIINKTIKETILLNIFDKVLYKQIMLETMM